MTQAHQLEMKRRTRKLLDIDLDSSIHHLRDTIGRFERGERNPDSDALLSAWREELRSKLACKLRVTRGVAADGEIRAALTKQTNPAAILGRRGGVLREQGTLRGGFHEIR